MGAITTTFHMGFGLVIGILTIEVFWWGVVLNNHSRWMHSVKHAMPHCMKDGWFRIFMASVMACGLSMIAFAYEIFICTLLWQVQMPHDTRAPWIIAGIQLSHIHLFAILARCSCLEVEDWPWLSRAISKCLNIDKRVSSCMP